VPSALSFHKQHAKEAAQRAGAKVAQGLVIAPESEEEIERDAMAVFNKFSGPWMVKPVAAGSSMGASVAKDFLSLVETIGRARQIGSSVLVEEYIKGREATCGVVDNFRGEDVYALFPIEIIPPAGTMHWSRTAKYDGSSQELCPGNFSASEKEELADLSKRVHKAMGLSHYSRSDFIVSPRGVYFLEVNTLPGLTSESLMPKAIKAAGATLTDFFTHLIELALGTRKRV
jgi:D-alanine-D-alanine ligase